MLILAIDPGPETCGVVAWDAAASRVLRADKAMSTQDVLDALRHGSNLLDGVDLVAIERVLGFGLISSRAEFETAELVGRMRERCESRRIRYVAIGRRDVLQALDVLGKKGSNDSLVRRRLLEMHPAGKGKKHSPGPLYGCAGHAWQALGLAVAVSRGAGDVVAEGAAVPAAAVLR